jgi:O-antigen ligase
VIPARSYRASRTGRLVAGSFVYQWTRVNLPTLTLLEEAAGLRLIPRRPWFFQAIGVAAVLAALASMLWGPLVLGFVALSFAATLFAPGAALLALPALLIWAPRLVLGDSGGEAVFLRLDQFVVAGLVARGLFHPAERLTSPPAHTAYILFLATLALSVVLGLFQGTLAAPMSALLYLAQWLEFYGLYVVAWNFGPRIQRFFPYAWALPLVALAAYGLAECAWPFHEDPNVRYRTFERALFPGQANHAAGLFALATATGLGMALNLRYRALGLALALLSTLALWPTGSRSGALAWAAGIGAFTLITVPTLRWWASPLLVLGLAAVPGSFWAARSAPGSSMHDRLVAWKSALSTVDLYPLLGLGAGARHRSYYDNHYLMTLAESGLVGMVLLLALLLGLARALGHGSRSRPDWRATGALAGLAALMVHGLATATFVVTMTAGPLFWYLGIALSKREENP